MKPLDFNIHASPFFSPSLASVLALRHFYRRGTVCVGFPAFRITLLP